MSRNRAIQLRIDMGDGDFLTIVATNNDRPLMWDVVAKIEKKLERLHTILERLEWGNQTEGGAA